MPFRKFWLFLGVYIIVSRFLSFSSEQILCVIISNLIGCESFLILYGRFWLKIQLKTGSPSCKGSKLIKIDIKRYAQW